MGDQGHGGSLSEEQLAAHGLGTEQPAAPVPANDSATQQAIADAAMIDKAYGDK